MYMNIFYIWISHSNQEVEICFKVERLDDDYGLRELGHLQQEDTGKGFILYTLIYILNSYAYEFNISYD